MVFSKDSSLNKSFKTVLGALPRVRIAVPVIIDRNNDLRAAMPHQRADQSRDDLVALFKSDLSMAVKRTSRAAPGSFADEFSRVNRMRGEERLAS